MDPRAFDYAVGALAEQARRLEIELIVSAEARGFIFGGALARELGVGFVPARKPGKLPGRRSASSSSWSTAWTSSSSTPTR